MKRILAPHKEQDGWVYWRVRPARPSNSDARVRNWTVVYREDGANTWKSIPLTEDKTGLGYYDELPGSRIISSRRVERAVENDDYLRLCAEEGLSVYYFTKPSGYEYRANGTPVEYPNWIVAKWKDEFEYEATGDPAPTLREAYHRYKAVADDLPT